MRNVSITAPWAQFSSFVEQAASGREAFEITRRGVPASVLISDEDLEDRLETLAMLSDPKLVRGIGRGLRDLTRGPDFTAKRVRAGMPADSS